MELNLLAIKSLIKERFRNNTAWFSEEIGIDKGYCYQILNGKKKSGSKKACDGVILYCKRNNLNYLDYIFLK